MRHGWAAWPFPVPVGGQIGAPRVCPYNRQALPNVTERHEMPERPQVMNGSSGRWVDEDDSAAPAFRPLTREEAQALRAAQPPLNPWRVVAVQAGVGVLLAALIGLVFGRQEYAWSALYGSATVVVPGALMARGMTSRLSSVSPGASAVSFMLWEMVKIGVSVAMLVLAPKLLQPLSWPALLAGLVVGLKVYWFALLWRGRS
jgi:ATP synthase protein I